MIFAGSMTINWMVQAWRQQALETTIAAFCGLHLKSLPTKVSLYYKSFIMSAGAKPPRLKNISHFPPTILYLFYAFSLSLHRFVFFLKHRRIASKLLPSHSWIRILRVPLRGYQTMKFGVCSWNAWSKKRVSRRNHLILKLLRGASNVILERSRKK